MLEIKAKIKKQPRSGYFSEDEIKRLKKQAKKRNLSVCNVISQLVTKGLDKLEEN